MPFQPIPNTARVILYIQKDTRIMQNVLYARRGAQFTLPQLAELASIAAQWWQDMYRQHVSTQHSLFKVIATDIHVEGGAQYTIDIIPPSSGILNQLPLTQNASVTISWRTGRTGRRYRGRSYMVGLTEPSVGDLDTVVGSIVTLIATTGAEWITRVLAGGMSPVVASLTYGTSEAIIRSIVENLVDSQRRRLPGRGT